MKTRQTDTRTLISRGLNPLTQGRLAGVAVVLAAAASATPAAAQQAYFSVQGEITFALGQHRIFFDLPTGATTSDDLFFRSYNNAGATNAAGDTTLGGGIDSFLELFSFNAGGIGASNDDGAAGANSSVDALLSWPGVAPDGGGTLPGTGLPAADDYRLTFSDLGNNSTGNWGVDLVGPASKIRLTQITPDAANPGGVSVLDSLKFGTTGAGSTPATFDYVGLTDLVIAGDLVVANTGHGTLEHDQGEITVGGTTTLNTNGNYNLNGGTLDLDGNLVIAGGAMNVAAPATLDRALGTTVTINNGGSLGHFSGTSFAGTDLSISGGGSATFNSFFGLGTSDDGTITVDGTGSSFTIDSGFNTFWATGGAVATLEITNDATASIEFAGGIDLADSINAATTGTFNINTGGDLTLTMPEFSMAENSAAATATINLDGAGSTVTHTGSGALVVGGTGSGSATINVSDNAVYTTGTGTTTINANGLVEVNTGGRFNANGDVDINSGSLTTTESGFSLADGKTVTATNDAQIAITGNSTFGLNKNNALVIESGSDVLVTGGYFDIGNNSGTQRTASVVVDGSGSTFNVDAPSSIMDIAVGSAHGILTVQNMATATIDVITLQVARNATGANTAATINVMSGGQLTMNNMVVGSIDGSAGTATINVDGSGSTLTKTGANILTLGNADTPGNGGVHTINVTDNAVFNTGTGATTIRKTGTLNINTGGVFNANGDVSVIGGAINAAGLNVFALAVGKDLTASADAQILFDTSTYKLFGGSKTEVNSGADLAVTGRLLIGNSTGLGEVIVDGAGSTFTTNTTSATGNAWGQSGHAGVFTVRNGGTASIGSNANLQLAPSSSAATMMTVNVESGGTFNLNKLEMAHQFGGVAVFNVTGAGSTATQSGASTITVGDANTSATGSAMIHVSDAGAFTTGTGATTINQNGTLKIDNGDFIANGAMTFAGGTLHTVINTGSEDPVQANAGVTIAPGSTLKLELDGALVVAENDVFAIIASTSPITSTFDTIDGRIIGGGLIFDQTILNLGGTSTLLAIVDSALLGDTDYDGDIDDSDLGTSFANYTGPVGAAGGKTFEQGDTDGDGDVDDSDLGTSFAGYTGPLAPATVPEPTSLALLGLAGLLTSRARRRRSGQS